MTRPAKGTDFFNNSQRYHYELRSLLTENFALTD